MWDANTLSRPVVRSDQWIMLPDMRVNWATPVAFEPVGGTACAPLRFAPYTVVLGTLVIRLDSRQPPSTQANAIQTAINRFMRTSLYGLVCAAGAGAHRKQRANPRESAWTVILWGLRGCTSRGRCAQRSLDR